MIKYLTTPVCFVNREQLIYIYIYISEKGRFKTLSQGRYCFTEPSSSRPSTYAFPVSCISISRQEI